MVTPGPRATPAACVFCGRPIEPGEATAGRAPMAAHAACADAALADDAHWDAVSEAGGGEEGGAADGSRRAGCLGVSSSVLVLLAVALLRDRRHPR